MADGPNPEEILASAPRRRFSGTVWRVHWRLIAPIDSSLSLKSSGRYHRGADLFPAEACFPALYTSIEPHIAIWEMVRRSAARSLVFLANNVLTALAVDIPRVVDLSQPDSLGLEPLHLTGTDVELCQEIGSFAHQRGEAALLVPSAGLPGLNLVLLPGNLPEPLPISVVRSTELPLAALG